MTTIQWEGVGGLVFFLAMSVLAIYFYGRNQRDIGYEEGRADHYDAITAELDNASAIPAGRHAAGQPRALPPLPPEMHDPEPAPDLNGADDTGTLERLSITGEISALTSDAEGFRDDLRADNEAWLKEWSASA